MSPEQIAREAAEALVEVRKEADGTLWLHVGGRCFCQVSSVYPDPTVVGLRERLTAAIEAAVERALREVPVPGGLSGRDFAEVLGVKMALDDAVEVDHSILLPDQARAVRDALDDVIADNNHLRRCLLDCGQDGSAAQYAAGYAAGRAAALAAFDDAQAASGDLPYGDAVRLIRERIGG